MSRAHLGPRLRTRSRVELVFAAAGGATAVGIGVGVTSEASTTIIVVVAALLGAGVFVLLLLQNLAEAILLLLVARASIDLVSDIRLGPLNVAAALALLVLVAGIIDMTGHRSFPGTQSSIFPYMLFLFWAGFAVLLAPDMLGGLKDWLRFASLLVIFEFVRQIASTEEGALRAATAIALSTVLPVGLAIFQFVTGQGFVIKQGEFVRVTGTFLHPNPFALYLAIVLPVIAALLATQRRARRWLWPLAIACLAALVMTFTRTAWIGLFMAILIAGWLHYRAKAFLIPVVVVALLLLVPGVAERFSDLSGEGETAVEQENSLEWRLSYWGEALKGLRRSPVWGEGLDAISATSREGKQAHNDYVRVLVETGVVGLGLLVWAYARLARRALAATGATAPPFRHAARLAFAGTMVSYLVMSATSNLLSQPAVQWYFWAFAAIALSGEGLTKDGRMLHRHDPRTRTEVSGAGDEDRTPLGVAG